MNSMIDYLIRNKEWLTLAVSIVVGLATIIATGVNAYLVREQNKIYKEQLTFQEKQNQPVFSIFFQLERDLDDGKYGTEIIAIRNVGHTTSQPCNVTVETFVKITKTDGIEKDSLYFPIIDYFSVAFNGNTGDNEVYYAIGDGSQRKYCEIYNAAIEASKSTTPNCYYFVNKVVLTKIEYQDIYNKKHELYFEGKKSISQERYDNICSQTVDDYSICSIRTISFPPMKEAIDKLK